MLTAVKSTMEMPTLPLGQGGRGRHSNRDASSCVSPFCRYSSNTNVLRMGRCQGTTWSKGHCSFLCLRGDAMGMNQCTASAVLLCFQSYFCGHGMHLQNLSLPHSPKTSSLSVLAMWKESSSPMLVNCLMSLQHLAVLRSTFQHRFCSF